ncbi:MAG: hypothetical protein Q8Q89_05185 [bacterium]|nr:hypothetical protein [bacterium]
MLTNEFIAQCILQHTEQGAIDWFIDNEQGGYFAVIDGWSIRLKGNDKVARLTYQKGPKFGQIVLQAPGFFNKDDTEVRRTLQSLLTKVKEQIYKDRETVKSLEEQEEKIKKEFCASMLGWKK